jgi:hypothetical protein
MPAQLGLWGKPFGAAQEITLASPTDQAEQIAGLKVSKDRLSWRVPKKELTVEVRLSEKEDNKNLFCPEPYPNHN